MRTDKSYLEAMPTQEINWVVIGFLLSTPLLAIGLLALYIHLEGFTATDLVPFFTLYLLGGLSITAGYHRYYAHRTFECSRFVQLVFLVFGAASVQNSVLTWASDHRYHHQFSDREGDPYSIKKGFFWAHMGWMFFKYGERDFSNSPDLKKDPFVMWQFRNYPWLAIVFGFGLPTLIGACFGRAWGGFLWGGLFRMVLSQQFTFMVNSVAHTFGRKTYSEKNTARDNPILALVTFGEGHHSFHHAFPSDYRNGIAWYDWDPAKWLILGLKTVGLAANLKSTNQQRIATRELSRVPESPPMAVYRENSA